MFRRILALLMASFLFSAPAFAGFDEGKQAYDKAHWIQAIINLRPAVEAGDARAMILLANMYMEGHGVTQDSKEAFGLYHMAALKNNTDGMVAAATLYQTGNGVTANTPLAVGWFERAARLGNMDAALIYAIHMYQGSKGKDYDIKPNHEASYRWFKIIAANSDNKKQAHAAQVSAERIAKSLTHDEIVQGDREVANWKPEMPEDIGPDPEQKFVADFNAKHPREEEPKPEEKKGAAAPEKPAPEKAPVKKSVKKPAETPKK